MYVSYLHVTLPSESMPTSMIIILYNLQSFARSTQMSHCWFCSLVSFTLPLYEKPTMLEWLTDRKVKFLVNKCRMFPSMETVNHVTSLINLKRLRRSNGLSDLLLILSKKIECCVIFSEVAIFFCSWFV